MNNFAIKINSTYRKIKVTKFYYKFFWQPQLFLGFAISSFLANIPQALMCLESRNAPMEQYFFFIDNEEKNCFVPGTPGLNVIINQSL